jgi:hypothetical protein
MSKRESFLCTEPHLTSSPLPRRLRRTKNGASQPDDITMNRLVNFGGESNQIEKTATSNFSHTDDHNDRFTS